MGYGDMPLTELRSYRPDEQEPADFDEFWAGTLAQSRSAGTDPVLDAVDNRLEAFTTTDVTFSGFDGQPIRAWLHLPAGVAIGASKRTTDLKRRLGKQADEPRKFRYRKLAD